MELESHHASIPAAGQPRHRHVAVTLPNADDPVARLQGLVDRGSLHLNGPTGVGARSGTASVRGTTASVFACDPRIGGGALSEEACEVIVRAVDNGVLLKAPIVGLWHSGGAKLQEGTASLHGVGRVFRAMVHASGRVPQISVVLGAAAGGAAYGPALGDFVVAGPNARIFVTGPDLVRRATGESVDRATYGHPQGHSKSGLVHVAATSDDEAVATARDLVALTARDAGAPTAVPPDGELASLVPGEARVPYDMHLIIERLLDRDSTSVEIHRSWAPNVLTILGRLGGSAVGVIANNPMVLCGCLNGAASEKAAQFVRTCGSLGVPLLVLVDVPGYLPGLEEEENGIVQRGAKLLRAFAEATVPRVTVILRKAYGGAFIAMNPRSLGATAVYAWPLAEVGIMYAANAVAVLHKRDLASASEGQRATLLRDLATEYSSDSGGLSLAVKRGVIDAIIDPSITPRMARAALTGTAG